MKRVLKLPVNEYWYNLIKTGKQKYDYREIKPYWEKRLEGQEYDIVEFYHRFKKNILPMRFKFEWIKKGRFVNYNMNVYIIMFGEKIDEELNESSPWIKPFDRAMSGTVRKEDDVDILSKEDFMEYCKEKYKNTPGFEIHGKNTIRFKLSNKEYLAFSIWDEMRLFSTKDVLSEIDVCQICDTTTQGPIINLIPKGGKNSDYIKAIDTIINNEKVKYHK